MSMMMKYPGFSLILITAVFIWTVPWTGASGPVLERSGNDTLSNEELHQFLTMFTPGKVEKVLIGQRPKNAVSHRPSPTPPSTSFLPTEVILPVPTIVRRKSFQGPIRRVAEEGPIIRVEEPSATALLQQLNLLNSLLDSNEAERKTNDKVSGILDGLGPVDKQKQDSDAVAKVTSPEPTLKELESLAFLTSLLTSSNPQNSQGLAPALRATSDQDAANFVASLLLAQNPGAGNNKVPAKLQDFSAFSNSGVNMDMAESNQLSGLLSLLGTLGSLNGGGGLLNLGQSQQPSLLRLLGQGGGQGGGFLGSMLGLNKHHTTRNTPQNQHHQIGALANLFAPRPQPAQPEPPGVVNSLVGLGSSVSTLLGQTFSGLSGTRADGKPRVRGVDTRLGLGYRLGQNMDAQMMWEVGPQIFTQALPNEKRDTDQEVQIPAHLQKQLLELLSRNQQLQKRGNGGVAAKVKNKEEDEDFGKLLQTAASQYSFHSVPPRRHHRGHHVHPAPGPFRPLPHYYMRSPNGPNSPRYPLLAKVPGPAPMVSSVPIRRRIRPATMHMSRRPTMSPATMAVSRRPTLSPATVLNSKSQDKGGDPYEMLTAYEKWLLNSAQGISKRVLETNENGHWDFPATTLATNQNLDNYASREGMSAADQSRSSKKIVRITRKSEEPIRSDVLMSRMGIMDPPQLVRPPIGPYSPMRVYHFPRRRFVPKQRRFHGGYFPPTRQFYKAPAHAQDFNYQAPASRNPYYNPHQNFIPESEDSFLRRNAIVTNPGIRKSPSFQSEAFGNKGTFQSEAFGNKGTLQSEGFGNKSKTPSNNLRDASVSVSGWVEPGALIGGMFKKAFHNPVTRLLFPTTPLPPVDDHTGGVFNPTGEPVLVATPTVTPLSSFFDHLGRPRPTKKAPNTPVDEEHPAPFIHIGEELSYKELAETMDLAPRPRVRTYKNGTRGPVKLTSSESLDRPLHPPGMEMFIDIDSGEVSVRKPIASLAHFGDITTTPKPKTEDELEDEESLKIFERLQEHFSSSMNEFKIQQEIRNATKEHKDKIRKEEDESLGMVNRYFDLLDNDEDDQVSSSPLRKRSPAL